MASIGRMIGVFPALFLAAEGVAQDVQTAAMNMSQGLLADGVELIEDITCEVYEGCKLDGSFYLVDTSKRQVSITSAFEYTEGKAPESANDNLLDYTLKTGSIATFSGGFFEAELNSGYKPLGGLKVNGNVVSSFDPDWKSSAVVCGKADDPKLTVLGVSRELDGLAASRKAFETNDKCIQSGPVVFDGDKTAKVLEAMTGDAFPDDFWTKQSTRNILVNFESGKVGMLYVTDANLSEINSALAYYSKNVEKIDRAVNLNGGPWSGYVVRTQSLPYYSGDMDIGFPSAIVVK